MPTVRELLRDPEFRKLSQEAQIFGLRKADPAFRKLSLDAQLYALKDKRFAPASDLQPTELANRELASAGLSVSGPRPPLPERVPTEGIMGTARAAVFGPGRVESATQASEGAAPRAGTRLSGAALEPQVTDPPKIIDYKTRLQAERAVDAIAQPLRENPNRPALTPQDVQEQVLQRGAESGLPGVSGVSNAFLGLRGAVTEPGQRVDRTTQAIGGLSEIGLTLAAPSIASAGRTALVEGGKRELGKFLGSTAAGIATGEAANVGVTEGAQALGVPEDVSRLLGTVADVVADPAGIVAGVKLARPKAKPSPRLAELRKVEPQPAEAPPVERPKLGEIREPKGVKPEAPKVEPRKLVTPKPEPPKDQGPSGAPKVEGDLNKLEAMGEKMVRDKTARLRAAEQAAAQAKAEGRADMSGTLKAPREALAGAERFLDEVRAKKGAKSKRPAIATITETPKGTFTFVGSVPNELAVVAKDGSPATPEQLRNAKQFGPRLAGVKDRSFKTREEAAQAFRDLNPKDVELAGAPETPKAVLGKPKTPDLSEFKRRADEQYAGWKGKPKTIPTERLGRTSKAKTPKGSEVETQFAVVEAADLVTSHGDDLSVNPSFPKELQPRDRGRLASEAQIAELESKLDPERLGENINAGDGAPIVGPDLVVESGNARSIAIRRAFQKGNEPSKKLRAHLEANAQQFGLTPEALKGVKNPVLVRVRKTDTDRAQFAREANSPSVAAMSATEQASSDAARLSDDLLSTFQASEDGEIISAANRDFIRGFLKDLPTSEQGGLIDAKGQLSQDGVRRVRNAIFHKAYGNPKAVERLAESTDNNARNISAGMLRAAPKFARLNQAIADGKRHDLGLSDEIAEAAETLSTLREKGQSVDDFLKQADFFSERNTFVDRLLMAFDKNKRSGKRIGDILTRYADTVDALGDPNQAQLFGAETPNRSEILTAAIESVNDAPSTQKALFGADTSARRETPKGLAGPEAGGATIDFLTGGLAKLLGRKAPQLEAPKPLQLTKPEPKDLVNPDDFFNFKKVRVSPGEKDQLRKLVAERAADKHAPKVPIPFSQIKAEARALHPHLVSQLKPPKAGETLRPEVRFAARERLNTLNDLALRKSRKLAEERLTLSPDQLAKRSAEIEALERDAKGLLDVLIPTRSQDGRNLAYHRIIAEKSFDSEFWIARARRKAGGALDPEVEAGLQRALSDARAAEAAGDTKALTEARQRLSDLFTKAEKSSVLETISALRKAGLLTGVKTQVRNLGGNTAFAAMREASRGPGAVADIALSLFTGRRTLTGPSLRAIGAAGREAATRGVSEAAEILKTGATAKQLERFDLQRELNSGSKVIDAYVNGVFRLMGAADKPFRAFGYRRALEGRARAMALTEARQGLLSRRAVNQRVRDLVARPPDALAAEALADAEVAVFAQETTLTKALSRFRGSLGPGGRFLMDLVAPFQRTPTNIVTQLLEFSGVSPKAVKAAASSLVTKSMTAEQQQVISEAIGKGAVGQALILLGYYLAEQGMATGVSSESSAQRAIDEAAGRLPGAILVNGRWRQISTFSPAGNLVTIGATMQRGISEGDTEADAAANVAAIATRTVLDQPLLTGAQEAVQALEDPSSRGAAAAARTIGSFVPTAVADIARLGDPVRRSTKGQGALGSAIERLPVLRKSLPERVDVLGQVQTSEKRTAIDPTISVPDKTKDRPGLKEMIRLGVGVSFPRPLQANQSRKEDETEPETAARQKLTGRLIEQSVEKLIAEQDYQRSDDETKRLAVKEAIQKARAEINKLTRHERLQALPVPGRVQLLEDLSAKRAR